MKTFVLAFPVPWFPILAAGLLAACTPLEPPNGCTLAAANRREVLRAHAYVDRAIRARILVVAYPGRTMGHAALVYRLEPEGWFLYDDRDGSRPLAVPRTAAFPAPMTVARLAFPRAPIVAASWY